jgi:putative MATE family efflux protein
MTVAMTIVVCVTMLLTSEALIRWIAGKKISERIILEGIRYYRIQIYGFPTVAFTITINAALRGAGNTRATFYNNSVANVVNVILNYCLISGNLGFPRMEVVGASLATVIGQCVGLIMAIIVVTGGRQYIRLKIFKSWKPDFVMIKRIINVGIPSFIEQLFMRIGALWYTTIATSLGDISYTAHQIAMNMQQLAFTTGMAFGTAATTLTGQCIGRKRIDLAWIYNRMTQVMGVIVSVTIAVLLFTCGGFLSGLYSDDTVIIKLASDMLKIIAVVNPIMNARYTYAGALRGAGDAKSIALVTFIGILVVRPLVALLLVNVLKIGLTGIWIALSSDYVIGCVVIWFRYRKGKWTKIVI